MAVIPVHKVSSDRRAVVFDHIETHVYLILSAYAGSQSFGGGYGGYPYGGGGFGGSSAYANAGSSSFGGGFGR